MLLDTIDLAPYPSLDSLTQAQLAVWPEHKTYLTKSYRIHNTQVMTVLERMADLVLKLAKAHAGGLKDLCADYRFVCEKMILEEEIYFRRHGKYRLSTFVDANREVYSKPELMARYMNGLLLSGIFWANHAQAHTYYVHDFLPGNKNGYDHLEVGCGHGLLIYFAGKDPRCGSVTGWDISTASLAASKNCLDLIGLQRDVRLKQQNVFEAAKSDDRFDSIVISEVLEHTEDPEAGLRALYHVLKPGGRIWVNLPINSPAPDHIYLLRRPEEAIEMVKNSGFKVIDSRFFPLTGYSEERARKHDLTINTAVIAMRD